MPTGAGAAAVAAAVAELRRAATTARIAPEASSQPRVQVTKYAAARSVSVSHTDAANDKIHTAPRTPSVSREPASGRFRPSARCAQYTASNRIGHTR